MLLSAGLFLISKKILSNNDDIDFNDIFHYRDLNHAVKLLGVAVLYWLVVMIGTMLFVIPGIIFTYRYSQALFIMAENPDLGPWEAMKKSQELMRGYKFNFFLFQLSFFLHILLIAITFGFYGIYFIPYHQTSMVNYYLKLKIKSII